MNTIINQSPQTSVFKNVRTKSVDSVSNIETILGYIKEGKYKDEILVSRTFGKGHELFDKIKTSVPTFTPNALFFNERNLDHLQSLTGYIYLDIDSKIDPEILNNECFIYSYWKSFSGNGYGLLIPISGLTIEYFKSTWSFLKDYFDERGVVIDPHSSDITRQCVVSYDPDIFINPDVVPLVMLRPWDWEYSGLTNHPTIGYTSDNTDTNEYLKIRYQTILDDYHDMEYVVIPEGKEYRNTYIPRIIEDGNRHKFLCSITTSLLFNNPTIDSTRLEKFLTKINQERCHPILSVREIKSIIKWSYRKHTKKEFNSIKTKKKKIWISPYKGLTRSEKKKIVGKVSGQLRRKKTLDELIITYKELSKQHTKVTQKLLEQHSKVTIWTIKKYWGEILEGVLCK